ncbi:response regulator transcription factor [Candidatus Bipolaricaulota bacterium]|nr:response regulator transcription factor [Candidatus Bipolaricaulota bacterium]TFH10873.1 MAG: response regulator transcription factor [Candidatus Atribacteria bacterium]
MTIRIVLADDHAIVRDGIRAILSEHADIEVVGEAEDGIQMVHETRRLCPDIVIVDITMPRMNGINAIRRLRNLGIPTRAIVLSMHSTVEHVLDALRSGAQGYVLKHSLGAELVAAIRLVAQGHRYLSKAVSESIVNHHLLSLTPSGVARRPRMEHLSSRERQILQLIVEGKTNTLIADTLRLSRSTIYTYRSRMMRKLGVSSLAELVRIALERDFTTSA